MLKSIPLILALVLVSSNPVTAQEPNPPSTEHAAVVQVVQQFFDALLAKDGDSLRRICQPGAQFTSGRPSADGYAVRQRSVESDIASFADLKETWLAHVEPDRAHYRPNRDGLDTLRLSSQREILPQRHRLLHLAQDRRRLEDSMRGL